MADKQLGAKDPRSLFREIDSLCDEVDSNSLSVEEADDISPMQRALADVDNHDRAKRKEQYSQLLSCRLLDVEIQPFEHPSNTASLMIRSSIGCLRHSVEIAECFALIEFLMTHDFVTLSTGKVRRDKDPREDEDRVFTWFILGTAKT